MKKLLIFIAVLAILALTACGSDPKWYQPDPEMPQAYIDQNQKALNDNLEILKIEPENIEAQFEIAYSYDKLGDYKKAVAGYKKVLEIDPEHYPALNNIAAIYEKVEEYELAAEYIKKLYVLNPASQQVITDTVRILLKADMPESAQEALENFVKVTRESEIENINTFISDLYESIISYKKQP